MPVHAAALVLDPSASLRDKRAIVTELRPGVHTTSRSADPGGDFTRSPRKRHAVKLLSVVLFVAVLGWWISRDAREPIEAVPNGLIGSWRNADDNTSLYIDTKVVIVSRSNGYSLRAPSGRIFENRNWIEIYAQRPGRIDPISYRFLVESNGYLIAEEVVRAGTNEETASINLGRFHRR